MYYTRTHTHAHTYTHTHTHIHTHIHVVHIYTDITTLVYGEIRTFRV